MCVCSVCERSNTDAVFFQQNDSEGEMTYDDIAEDEIRQTRQCRQGSPFISECSQLWHGIVKGVVECSFGA